MKRPKSRSNAAASTESVATTPVPIRLVDVFIEAVQASKPERELAQEALSVEMLVIAGIASFDTLNRLDILSSAIEREGQTPAACERWEVEIANHNWWNTATILKMRLDALGYKGFESKSFALFSKAFDQSCEINAEAADRDRVERQALRSSELAALAAKLRPRQDVYDE